MEEAQSSNQTGGSNAHIYYIIGAVVLVAVIAVGYFLRPQQAITPVTTTPETAGVTTQAEPVKSEPITGLDCEQQYYNPVVGVPGNYYLSVEGVAESSATSVNCSFVAEVDEEQVGAQQISTTLIPAPERGGKTFKCTTQGMELTPTVPTKVSVELTDDLGNTSACFRFFNLP